MRYEIEQQTPFSKSLIWQLNREFYSEKGISAWSDDIVPHHLTSNARVGRIYAELIFAVLKDRADQGENTEVVYILELGAGHGRLAFHVLKHLEHLCVRLKGKIPPYCYVLSDIVEENLAFFYQHPQFQNYLDSGILEVSFFDASNSTALFLRQSQKTITPQTLQQPLLAIANYFFDSLPSDLFFLQDNHISACSVAIHSKVNPDGMDAESVLENMELIFRHSAEEYLPHYEEGAQNDILEAYRQQFSNTYLFFPAQAMACLQRLKAFSQEGLVLLSMDKGFHELADLNGKEEPQVATHGSISLWVNYHALNTYCERQGGKAFFPSFSNFHLEVGCLLFLMNSETYRHTAIAYEQFIDDFGPDDFNSMKQLAYSNLSSLSLKDLLALYRLSAYDSTFFIKLLPRLKHVYKKITFKERRRLAQTMDCIWQLYFNINETFDLAYEIGGILYNLGYYHEALGYFEHSVRSFGLQADVYYNQALCYYQLREDQQFYRTMKEGQEAFPDFALLKSLDQLEMD